MPQVLHLPFEHCYALHTHSESESAVLLAVYAGCLKHIRVHHSATQNFKPAGTLAHVATLSVADIAAHVHLRRRLCEREIGRTHTDFCFRTEHLPCEQENGLLHIRESHPFVNIETFHLMENAVCAGRDGFVSEHAAGADDANRQRKFLHCTHLN